MEVLQTMVASIGENAMTCGDVPPAKWEIPTWGCNIVIFQSDTPVSQGAGLKCLEWDYFECSGLIPTKFPGLFCKILFDKTPHKAGCSIYKEHAIQVMVVLVVAQCFQYILHVDHHLQNFQFVINNGEKQIST